MNSFFVYTAFFHLHVLSVMRATERQRNERVTVMKRDREERDRETEEREGYSYQKFAQNSR